MKGESGTRDPRERTEIRNEGVMKNQVLSQAPCRASWTLVEEALFSWKTFSYLMRISTIVCLRSFRQQKKKKIKMDKWRHRVVSLVSFWFSGIGVLGALGRQHLCRLLTGGTIWNCSIEALSIRWESTSYCGWEPRAREEGRGDVTRYYDLEESLQGQVACLSPVVEASVSRSLKTAGTQDKTDDLCDCHLFNCIIV